MEKISEPVVSFDSENTMSITWRFENSIFGICFDENITDHESGWWYVNKLGDEVKNIEMKDGKLPKELITILRRGQEVENDNT